MNRRTNITNLVLLLAIVLPAAVAGASEDETGKQTVTFTKNVLPVLQQNCQRCHRPGGANLGGMVAPMAFTTYDEVRPWAKSIAREVQARNMPPWDASPEYHGVFVNERSLTDSEIDTIVSWVEAGAPRGVDEDAPEPIEFPDAGGWQIGEPDLVVEMPERYFVEDDVEDLYVSFYTELTPEQLPEDRLVKAIEFRPGSSVVHHIISNPLGGIAPGNDPTVFKDGYYQTLQKGATISFEMHYHKEPGPGTGVWDRSSVALKFYPKDAETDHQIRLAMLMNEDFVIPAGDPNYTATAEELFDRDIELVSFTPHMHLRGKSAFYKAHYPDGTTEALLDVPHYDFNWQTSYEYAEPKTVPAGTKIHLKMAWDNSADNPYNPDPTSEVRFGEPTTAEMMFGFVRYAYAEEPKVLTLDAATLLSYAGTYLFGGDGDSDAVTFMSDGARLTANFIGHPSLPLTADGVDEFSYAMIDMKFRFERNEAGEVIAMNLDFQKEESRAVKAEVAAKAEVMTESSL